MNFFRKQQGFTLVELLIVIGLFTIITSFVLVGSLRPQISSSVISNITQVTADIKHQQLKAMEGKLDGGADAYKGVYFDTNNYVLFTGSSYNASDPNNFEISFEGVVFTDVNLPSSQIVFEPRSGEVANYSSSENSFVLQSSAGFFRTVSINEYGALTIN